MSKRVKKLKKRFSALLKKTWVVYIVAFAIIGVVVLIVTHAATSSYSFNTSDGSVSGNAQLLADTTGSSGNTVKFGVTNGGGSSTGTPVSGGRDNTCALQGLVMAFCDGFGTATVNKATDREGDLNAAYWGVSRFKTTEEGGINSSWAGATMATPCAATTKVLPPKDIQICNGRLYEAVNDNESQSVLAMYAKQPFDFTGRTDTLVFDLSADSQGPHAAWPEVWITDKPVPAPKGNLTTQAPYAPNSFGVLFAYDTNDDTCPKGSATVREMQVTRNYQNSELNHTFNGCFKMGTAQGSLNHFKIQISQNLVQVYGTDAGADVTVASNWKLLATGSNANLSFTKGVVWMEDVHYNACKFNSQCDHEFAWDNVGFDGPLTYRDLTFDVPDHTGSTLSYDLPASFTINGVKSLQTPTAAYVLFDYFSEDQTVPSVSVNGNTAIATAWPFDSETYAWRTIAVPVPLSQINDGGTNTVKISGGGTPSVANIDILLVAGSPIPNS